MPVLTLVSAKGSPGVTTAAAALAAAATAAGDAPALLVELDPAGGDVRILTGAADDGGVVGAAGELRRDVSSESIGRHVSIAPPGLPVLLAPTAGLMATSVIGSVLDRWGPALRQHGGTVVVDGGRWDSSQPTARRAGVGDLVAILCRPTVAGVEHARQTVDRLREVAHCPVVAVIVGNRPYAPAEVAGELDLPLAGSIAWDPRGTSALWAKGITRAWGRTWLAASAASTLDGLLALAPAAEPVRGAAPRRGGAGRHRPGDSVDAPAAQAATAGAPGGGRLASGTPQAGRPPVPPNGDRHPPGALPPPPANGPGPRPSGGARRGPLPSQDQAAAPPAPDAGLPTPPMPAYGADRAVRRPSAPAVPSGPARPAPPPAPRPVGPAPVSGERPAMAPGTAAAPGAPPFWRNEPQQLSPIPPEWPPTPGAPETPASAPLHQPPSGPPAGAGQHQIGQQPARPQAGREGDGRQAANPQGGRDGDGRESGERQGQGEYRQAAGLQGERRSEGYPTAGAQGGRDGDGREPQGQGEYRQAAGLQGDGYQGEHPGQGYLGERRGEGRPAANPQGGRDGDGREPVERRGQGQGQGDGQGQGEYRQAAGPQGAGYQGERPGEGGRGEGHEGGGRDAGHLAARAAER